MMRNHTVVKKFDELCRRIERLEQVTVKLAMGLTERNDLITQLRMQNDKLFDRLMAKRFEDFVSGHLTLENGDAAPAPEYNPFTDEDRIGEVLDAPE